MTNVRILIVDDSKAVRTHLQRMLRREGYEVIDAMDGVDALRKIREQCPDLAILDINMPLMDGYGVCQELSQMGRPWNELPIVFLTAERSKALQLLGSARGAYLTKPVSEHMLAATVHGCLEVRRRSASPRSELADDYETQRASPMIAHRDAKSVGDDTGGFAPRD